MTPPAPAATVEAAALRPSRRIHADGSWWLSDGLLTLRQPRGAFVSDALPRDEVLDRVVEGVAAHPPGPFWALAIDLTEPTDPVHCGPARVARPYYEVIERSYPFAFWHADPGPRLVTVRRFGRLLAIVNGFGQLA